MVETTPTGASEAGFALIEVIVSAVVAITIAAGIFGLLESSARSAGEERHRSVAYALAQEDEARLRAMQVPSLNNLNQTRIVTVDGTPFTVKSSAIFVNDSTGTSSCGKENASADYVKASSTVTWPSMGSRPPVVIAGIIAPPNGSLDPTHGTLTVSVENARGLGVAGIGVSGVGAGSFSGVTDASGCAQFVDQAAGNYTLTPSAPTGFVEKDGNPPQSQIVTIVAGTTTTTVLQYDRAGSIEVEFLTRVGGKLVSSSADSVVVFNTGMTTAKAFGSPGGTRTASLTATPLFPFTSADTVYAGSCTGDNPNPTGVAKPPGAAALANVLVPSGGTVPATVQLPALNLTVWSGTSTTPVGPVSNAHVTVADRNCPVTRTYATNVSGNLADPGLPWSDYDVCVDDGVRRQLIPNVSVRNLTSGTVLPVYMNGPTATLGTCP